MVLFGTRVASLSDSGAFGKGLWDKPEEFDPARWLGDDGKFNLKAGFSLPFGIGPRSCPGKALAVSDASTGC